MDDVVVRPVMRSNRRTVTLTPLIDTDDHNMSMETFILRRDQHFLAQPPGPAMNRWLFKYKDVYYMGLPEDFEPVPPLEILAALEKTKGRRKS